MDRTDARRPSGSQSKLPSWIFFALLAALVFRIVTAAMDRAPDAGEAGLVRWQPNTSARSVARASGKPVLYDFTAEWCAPCKILDQEGWGDAPTARMASEAFVPVRVMDRLQEEGRNPPDVAELQARYRIGSFPTLVVADADGREILRHVGFRNRLALQRFLTEARAKSRAGSSD